MSTLTRTALPCERCPRWVAPSEAGASRQSGGLVLCASCRRQLYGWIEEPAATGTKRQVLKTGG